MATRHWSFVVTVALTGAVAGSGNTQPPAPLQAPAPRALTGGLPEGAVARLGQTRLRHAERPNCVAFTPDGKTFVTGGEDGTVRVWSVATGELVRMTQKPGYGVATLCYTQGGTRLAVHYATQDVIRLLEPATLQEMGSVALVNRPRFAFSPDSALIATSDTLGNAVVTEIASDLPKLELPDANVFDFRPDGKAIAVGSAKGTVTVHLVTGGKPTFKLVTAGAVLSLVYSPDGRRLAVGTRSPEGLEVVRIYTDSAETPVAEIEGMSLPVAWLDKNMLSVGNGTEAAVYDLAKKEFSGRMKITASAFAVSPDGTKVATTGNGGLRVRLWDLATGQQLHAENDTFPDPALMIGTRDGDSLFLLAADTAFLWPLRSPGAKAVGRLPGRVVSAAVGRETLAVATPDAVYVYTHFDPLKPLPAKPHFALPKSAKAKTVSITPDGKRVAWADETGTVFVAEPADTARAQLPIVTTSVLALAFSPDGTKLAQLGRDGFLRLWSVGPKAGDFSELWKTRLGRGPKATIAFSPDGKLIAAASLAQVPVFNVADGTEVFKADRYSDEGLAQHATFSPDNRLLVFGSSGTAGRVEVWELATHGLVRAFSTGYGGISRLCVFPDGNRFASAGAEEAVTVWDLTASGNKAPKPSDLNAAWVALDSSDAGVGYPAIKFLASAGDRGTDVMAKGTKELLATQKKMTEWVADLGSPSFVIREAAAKELLALGVRAIPALNSATRADDTDVRDRALELLQKIEAKGVSVPAHGLAGDTLRLIRAVQALEQIGSPQAGAVLREIARTGGRPGTDAKAALDRFAK